MRIQLNKLNWALICEGILTLVVLRSAYESALFFFWEGRLPPPYFFDTNDTFMDWFNVAYWAHNPGAYDTFLTVYPPLSYVFLKLTTVASCYKFDGRFARECDWAFPWVLAGFYLLNVYLVWRCYRKKDKSTALMRTATMSLGLPMLFSVERGQLLIPCFTAFVLAHGNILRSARWKWVWAAVTINFKPYLVLTAIPNFLRRRWSALEGYAVATVAVYLLTWGLFGSGSVDEIWENTVHFGEMNTGLQFYVAYYQTTYNGILMALDSVYPFTHFMGSTPVELMANGFPILMIGGALAVGLCILLSMWRPYAIPVSRLTALSVAAVITNSLVGGYTQILLFFLVLLEPWRGPARITALIAVYLLSISWDVYLVNVVHGVELSYLSNRLVGWDIGVSLGEMVRPGLILLIEYALVIQSLIDVWNARKPSAPPALAMPTLAPQPA